MPSDILDSKIEGLLYQSRWLFISSRYDAIVFLVFLAMFSICIAGLYIFNPTEFVLNKFVSVKYNPVELVKMSSSLNKDTPNVLLLGGSTSRELTGDNTFFSERLSRACGKEVDFVNAGSSSQNYVTSQSLFAEYARNNVDLVIIGMNYYRLILDPVNLATNMANNGQLVPVPLYLILDELPEVQTLPVIQPFYMAAKLKYHYRNSKKIKLKTEYNKKRSASEFLGFQNKYKGGPRSAENKSNIVRSFLLSRYPDYQAFSHFGTQKWLEFVDHAKSKGSIVLFLVLPEDPSLNRIRPFFVKQFDEFLKLAKQKNAKVVDWRSRKLNLDADDFYDQQHFLSSGRKKTSRHLARLISTILPDCRI